MDKALEGKRLAKVPTALEQSIAELASKGTKDVTLVRFAMRLGSSEAYDRAVNLAVDSKTPENDRIGLIDLLGQTGKTDCVAILLSVLEEAKSENLRGAALSALQPFADRKIGDMVLAQYSKLSPALRGRAQGLLC
ncbi:MAG TPA: hypothetical protein VGG61_01285, partial [Gemmataceae bacterium]